MLLYAILSLLLEINIYICDDLISRLNGIMVRGEINFAKF